MSFNPAQGSGGSGGAGTPDDNSVSTVKVQDAAVTLAKMADLAQDKVIGRTTASTGVPEVFTVTAAARTVLDDTTVGAMVDTLGGASATGSGGLARATSPTLVTPLLGTPTSGTLTNCTGLPTGGIVDGAVTLAKMANLAQDTFIVRTTASTGVPEVATVTAAARTVLDDTTVVAMLATMSGVAGVASGYKIARGVASITGSGDVSTGLSTVVAVICTSQSDISAVNLGVSATVGDQAGSPAAGSITIKVWKPTAANNVTMIAATNAMDINWLAIGT